MALAKPANLTATKATRDMDLTGPENAVDLKEI